MSEHLRMRKMAKIQALAQACGYQVFGEYVNRNTRLTFRCVVGHQYEAAATAFVAGNRCAECSGTKRKSIEDVRRDFEARGYKLLSKEFLNTKTPLEVECTAGHRTTMRYNNFQQGHGCKACGRKATHENRLNVNKYLKLAELNGIQVLNPEDMKDIDSLLRTRCTNGHIREVKISSYWLRPYCPQCVVDKNRPEPIDRVVARSGYTLTDRYLDETVDPSRGIEQRTRIVIRCPAGHEYRTTPYAFRDGARCNWCSAANANRLNEDKVFAEFKKEGYTILGKYQNATTPIPIRCPAGHDIQLSWGKWKYQGVRCGQCWRERPRD